MTGELRLVEDAEERRHGTIDAATRGFEDGSPLVVDGDAELSRARDPANDVSRRCFRLPSLVRDRERPDRFSELAEAGRVGARDSVARRHEPLLSEPRLGPFRGSDAIPVVREVVVVGVDEALKQLESPGCLGSPSGLDLLAHPSLVALVHDAARSSYQTSIMQTLVRRRNRLGPRAAAAAARSRPSRALTSLAYVSRA